MEIEVKPQNDDPSGKSSSWNRAWTGGALTGGWLDVGGVSVPQAYIPTHGKNRLMERFIPAPLYIYRQGHTISSFVFTWID